jgi:hypothetical protein
VAKRKQGRPKRKQKVSAQASKRKPNPAAKRKPGRPTDYVPELCEAAIEMGRQGKSRLQIAASIGKAKSTLQAWEDKYPAFAEAMALAKELEQAWWEDMGQKGLKMGKNFNATAFIFQMKNRFRSDYRDTHEIENTNKNYMISDQPLSEDEWARQYAGVGAPGGPAAGAD